MNTLLLFLILLTQLSVAFMFRALLTLIRDKPDFTSEDSSVKAMTEEVAEAEQKLPPTKGK